MLVFFVFVFFASLFVISSLDQEESDVGYGKFFKGFPKNTHTTRHLIPYLNEESLKS